ncbi:MAG: metallophosphoesterase [Clostridia bacterium]|nr:metallophosphoesterase [Clostridia bacterium]
MAIYAISDLHLGLSADKPMDIFGARWENYLEILKDNWQKTIGEDDLVLLPGDTSWATYVDRAEADFDFLNSLPGTKLISKGNHDYWWETLSKLNAWAKKQNYSTIRFMHNSVYIYNDVVICAAKGYPDNGKTEEDKKLYNREVSRLKLSLDMAKDTGAKTIYVMLHYPPSLQSDFARLLEDYGVSKCFYGHLHGGHHAMAVTGVRGGVDYQLVSADYLRFQPLFVCE